MLKQLTKWLNGPNGSRHVSRRGSPVLRCEALEDREVPAGLFVAGVGGATQAADPEVSIYATVGPNANQRVGIQLEAFGGAAGDVRVALGDVNGDGTDDIIAAAGKGGGSEVAIFDGAAAVRGVQSQLARFFVYSDQAGVSQNRGFEGGVFVASTDLNNDGFAELITTPGLGGRGHLKVFDFNDGTGGFLGSNPSLRASAYTFTDYNGEIRVAASDGIVVTASGAGVPGDVRGYGNLYTLGSIADGTPVPSSFLLFRFVPFDGYAGGLSIAIGDTNEDSRPDVFGTAVFVSKNDGPSTVAVYPIFGAFLLTAEGNPNPPAFATFEAFAGFSGEVRVGSADVDGDGYAEVLTTTGFSGDPQGTPVKAWKNVNGTFVPVQSFYSNPGYLPGAWLAGSDFNFSQDVTTFRVGDNNAYSNLPAKFETNADLANYRNFEDVGIGFPDLSFSGASLPKETVTGASLPFRNIEVTLAFNHTFPSEATVQLVYTPGDKSAERVLSLFDGPGHPGRSVSKLRATFTDDADAIIPDASPNTLTGRFRADGGSLHNFINSLPDRNGTFLLTFQDSVAFGDGTVPAAPAPFIRLIY